MARSQENRERTPVSGASEKNRFSTKSFSFDEEDREALKELILLTRSKTEIQALRTAIGVALLFYKRASEGQMPALIKKDGRIVEVLLQR